MTEKVFKKKMGKGENADKPAFSPFPTVFSTLSKREIIILAIFNLSANHFDLVTSKILSLSKEISDKNVDLSNPKHLQATIHV